MRPCLVVSPRLKKFTAAQWAALYVPQQLGKKRALSNGQVVFEWDSKYATKKNPGVGKALGTVVDAGQDDNDQVEVAWADGGSEMMSRVDLALSCGISHSFVRGEHKYTLDTVLENGVLANVSLCGEDNTKKVPATRSQFVTPVCLIILNFA